MRKTKKYQNTVFSGLVLEEAYKVFVSSLDSTKEEKGKPHTTFATWKDSEEWTHDSLAEFMAEYDEADGYRFRHESDGAELVVYTWTKHSTEVSVAFSTRDVIESVFRVFERNLERSKIVRPRALPRIFIGHGRDSQWRDLKDHLHDHHGMDVVAYEVGPRAGLSVKEVLEQMLNESSLALLVLTGEDIRNDGELHARQNVVHEVGLFQGRLGFNRAVVLLEEGVHEFSNILGVNQVRFSKGAIRETFGDVLATVKREFGED